MPQYNFTCSENITYRTFTNVEINNLHQQLQPILSNPDNVTYYRTGQPWSDDAIYSFINDEQKQWPHYGYGSYAAYQRTTDQFIGFITLNPSTQYPTHPNAIDMGYVVAPRYAGQGYGKEMAQFAYVQSNNHYAQQRLEETQTHYPTEMIATVHPENSPSQKILARVLENKGATTYNPEYQAPRLLFFKRFDDNKGISDEVNTKENSICTH